MKFFSTLQLVLDGKTHTMTMGAQDKVLDTGLDLPYACRGGVCCTCRARAARQGGHGQKLHTWATVDGDRLCAHLPGPTPHRQGYRQL